MHWPPILSLPLLLLFTASIPSTLISAAQRPLQYSTQSTTLVDALSADPDYTSLLHLLQRARLIPTLNRLNGSTFFAPTNEAIKRHSPKDSLWAGALEPEHFSTVNDNVRERLRQELFYHLINYTLLQLPEDGHPAIHSTLHFPRQPLPPSREPPPLPPWLPEPGGTLGGYSQRLRLATRDSKTFVGVDAFGKGGAKIIKDRVETGNGVLYAIDRVIDVPPDLGELCSCVVVWN